MNPAHIMEHTGRAGISPIYANSSVNMFDFNTLALMEATATAHAGDHNSLLYCTDLMQGNCGPGSLIPISPSPSSHVVDLQGCTFGTSDSLWASHDLPVKSDQCFQPPLHPAEATEHLRIYPPPSSFIQDQDSIHLFGGLDIPYETNIYGGSILQGRVDKQEPNCGYSSDEIDDMKDEDEKGSQDGRSSQPTTLHWERRRRGQLNERLYTLRSLVPKITKMDKASIVGDTISYVQDLQKELKDMQTEIEELRSNINRHNDSPAELERNPAVLSDMENEIQSYKVENGNSATPPNSAISDLDLDYEMQSFEEGNSITPTSPTIDVNVSKVQDRTFHIRLHFKKKPGALIRLMRALESIQLDFHNANLTSVDGHVIKTATVKIEKPHLPIEADALRGAILGAASKYGFMTT